MDYTNRKMKANYHTHTYHCNHASSTPREYVEKAIERGLDVLGFACHAPQPFPGDYYSGFRMKREQQETYVKEILALREEYKDEIEILLGYETEYYPALFRDTLELLNRYPCDYIIMGQHFVDNEYDTDRHVWCTGDLGMVRDYVRQTCEAMRLGVYTYFAHPDMMAYYGEDREAYLDVMSEICRVSLETDTPLELNMLGLREGRLYPSEDFFEMVGRYGCKVIIGCDAHDVEGVAHPDTWDRAVKKAERCSLNLVDYVEVRRPKL